MIKTFDGSSFKRVGGKPGDRSPAAGFTRLRVVYTATGGETSINLASLNAQFSYTPGAAQITVKRSTVGTLIAGFNYSETSNTTIGFPSTSPLAANEVVEVTREIAVSGIAALSARPDGYETTGTSGQTVVTASFSWPYALSPCGVRVYVNGIRQRRGLDFTETNLGTGNTNQITLVDSLSGGENIIMEPTYQAIDQTSATSTFNSTQLSNIQSSLTAGTQGFVDQSAQISVPATGIVNRAKIPDLSNDLRASMGIERIAVQQIYPIQSEYGASGEPVWGALNDDRGLIRFVGPNWQNSIGSFGIGPLINAAAASGSDYLEITFYGTGLNLILNLSSFTTLDLRATVDGGSEGSNFMPAAGSGVLAGRNYNNNTVIPAVSGLTLGVHTVKIRVVSNSGIGLIITGFEAINANSATNVNVNAGSGYIGGQKLSSLTAQTFAYNTVATGTRGGRTVVYTTSTGTVGQSWQAVNASQANLSSTDHTNEEVVRTYQPREFGAGRSDDFSVAFASSSNLSFTLDDGSTTLVGSAVGTQSTNLIYNTSASAFIAITFVGTGLDVNLVAASGSSMSFTSILVDGSSIGSLTLAGNFASYTQKIVSGLPYGTHTVKFVGIGTSASPGIAAFKVYQPKKPTVPSNAVELADYNVMATYSAATGAAGSAGPVSTGALYKAPVREFNYSGTWSVNTSNVTGFLGGFYTQTSTTTDYVEYTFFGAGVEIIAANAVSASTTIQIDGSAYTGTATAVNGGSWTAGTSTWALPSAGNGQLQITGLSLGVHKIRATVSALGASGIFQLAGITAITPLHSYKNNLYADTQNSLSVGSCAISDNRKTTMLKESLPSQKAWAQATGVTSSPTTNSTSFVPCPDLSITLKTSGSPLDISYSTIVLVSSAGSYVQAVVYVDGTSVGSVKVINISAGSAAAEISDRMIIPTAPGVHKIDVYWSTNATATAYLTERTLVAKEI